MSGKILAKARRDSRKYITKGGFEEILSLTSPNGLVIETTGTVSKHWINFDSEGNSINSKNSHICINENELLELGYPVRNNNEEVYLKDHRVSTPDSTGVVKDYVIREWFPDENLGLIVCILGDYE